ncbi:DUF3997 domain-containing protein [uncultured Thomasclavelia sp.]|uniref:DUF3997 domain-containing protein n=1 Tax=uncultured Thomasclavelia sp. TaxID=3025759 RepID=UPI00280B11C6|nr:DUF3997 domain-containing protein [uncultured Thomasclavelia sp.]
MKKISFLILILLILTSCTGTNDWKFSLPNGYEVWRINSSEIKVVSINNNVGKEIIPSFVKEFAYDSQYVFTRNIDNISTNNIFNEEFYILDTKSGMLYGPYNDMEDLRSNIEKLKIELPINWYRTSPDPNIQNVVTS